MESYINSIIQNIAFQPPLALDHKFNFCHLLAQKIPYFKYETPLGYQEDPDKIICRVLYNHGNQEDLSNVLPKIRLIYNSIYSDRATNPDSVTNKHKLEFIFYAWDYPFYGISPEGREKLNEETIKSNALEMFNFMMKEKERESQYRNVTIVWGYSLGVGVSCSLLDTKKVDFMYLEAPYVSLFKSVEISALHLTVLMRIFSQYDMFKNEAALKRNKGADEACYIALGIAEKDKIFPCSKNLLLLTGLYDEHYIFSNQGHSYFAYEEGSDNLGIKRSSENFLGILDKLLYVGDEEQV